jgi:formate hydrogenlyase transcriptional activator
MIRLPHPLEVPPIDDPPRLHNMVGQSPMQQEVWRQIDTVAMTDCTVLVLGETGTGKELVAKAVHERSARRGAAFVTLNCSAIPSTLLESELFGHEKGAFTGATARRAGRFELAEKGTLFLDEIGELGLDLQPKLLRLLQERQFERLGSSQTLRGDVRVVAATNRDLGAMCDKGAFREDLYYRLNVFPILLPALRERREDIPLLVRHFVSVLAQRMGKDFRRVSAASMASLVAYDWPGNIRQLQNVLERAVILGSGPELELRDGALVSRRGVAQSQSSGTLADVQRAHILAVLESTNGVVAGPKGAAARLGIKRSTLLCRMKKLGISHRAPNRRYETGAPHLLGAANN